MAIDYRKSGDHYILASILIAIIFSTLTAAIVWEYEAGLPPWLYSVSFGGEANTTNGVFEIIFNPEVTHNQSNDTILFKAKIVNVGSKPVDLFWGRTHLLLGSKMTELLRRTVILEKPHKHSEQVTSDRHEHRG